MDEERGERKWKEREDGEEVKPGRKKRLPTRLNETYREARGIVEKELKLISIQLQNQSGEELQRKKI